MSIRRCRAHHRGERGYLLIEILVAALIGVIGILAHVSSTVAQGRQSQATVERGAATLALEKVAARLRADEDWAGIYDRLRHLQDTAGINALTTLRLGDGGRTWPPSAYFADLAGLSPSLGDVGVLIEVPPRAKPTNKPLGVKVLREDWVMPELGLPHDLNADGVINGLGVESDYTVLPARIRLVYQPRIGAPCEVRMCIWLRGDR